MLTLGSSVNVHIHHSVAQHHHTCCIGSGFSLPWENMEEPGEEVDRNHKDRTWCLLTPSPTLQRPHTLRLGTPRASSYGCSAPALLSPSYLHLPWARHTHTHTHTHSRHKHMCVYKHAQHGGTNTNREDRLLKHLCFLFGFVSPC